MALDVPVFVVINKVDACSKKALNQTLNTIEFLLKSPGCGKIPMIIENEDDAVLAAQHFVDPKFCPIFTISCVEGTNINLINKFLNVLPPLANKKERESKIQDCTEFRVRKQNIVFLKRINFFKIVWTLSS